MPEVKYKRVLLKVSGEALAGEARRGLDFTIVNALCDSIKACVQLGVQLGLGLPALIEVVPVTLDNKRDG